MPDIKNLCDFYYQDDDNFTTIEPSDEYDLFATYDDFPSYLYGWQRILLGVIFIVIVSIAIVGNISTLFTTAKRKYQTLYKSCLICLAVSDFLMALFVGVDKLDTYANEYSTWRLGRFMCSWVPFITTACSLVSSMTLICIAVDRYQGLVMMTGKWNPKLNTCLVTMGTIWLVAGGISVPTSLYYTTVRILLMDCKALAGEITDGCNMTSKEAVNFYFTIIFALIFLPILAAFLGIYSAIANYIWLKRKPPGAYDLDPSTMETNTSENPSEDIRNAIPQSTVTNNRAKSTAYTEKKKRTFKIVLVILGTFCVCRLPQWIFIVATSHPNVDLSSNVWAFTKHLCSALSLANCAINPLIYSFLSEIIHIQQKVAHNVGNWKKFNIVTRLNKQARSYSVKL